MSGRVWTTLCPAGGCTRLLSPTDRLAEAKIERELSGTSRVIDRNDGFTRRGSGVQQAPFGRYGCSAGSGGKGGPVVEDGVAVQILPQGNVKRRSGVCHQERIETDTVGKIVVSPQKEPVPDVICRAPLILSQIVLVRRKTGSTAGIAAGRVQRVVASQR